METEKIRNKIGNILCKIIDTPIEEIEMIENLYEEGYMDSIEIMELVLEIEDTFGIEIPDSKLLFSELRSIDSISEIIKNELDN